MWHDVLDLFFPHECTGCGRVLDSKAPFCRSCVQALEPLPPTSCLRCGEPSHQMGLCRVCTNRRPPMERSFAPFLHQGPLARAIHRWKYEDHPELTRPLCEFLVQTGGPFLKDAPRTIAPIPLHVSRYRQRKYDQAVLLAHALSKQTGRPFLEDALTRVQETQRQVGLAEEARERNVQNAFAGNRACEGRTLLLIDDVFTTGATARAAAGAALAAGAAAVWVLTLARAHTGP